MSRAKYFSRLSLIAFFLLMMQVFCFTAFAESSISRVRVYVSDDKLEDEEELPEVTLPSTANYSITDVEAVTKRELWKPGASVKIAVYLEADDGYVFTAKDKDSFTVSGASYSTSSLQEDGHKIKLVLKFGPIRSVLGTPENPRWSETELGRAIWKKVDNAKCYYVYLVKDDDVSGATRYTAETNYIDLKDKMNANSNYYFRVQAVPKDSSDRKYKQSGELADSGMFYGSSLGETGGNWRKDNLGYKYHAKSGEQYANAWKLIEGNWYYFDQNGYRAAGWIAVDGKRYYCDEEGKMKTGWLSQGEDWYYLMNNGEAAIGWFQTMPSIWYYTNADGKMLTGWQDIGGRWYYLKPSGELATSQNIDGYYVNQSGEWIP